MFFMVSNQGKSFIISGWWFGTCFIFPYIGNVIIPTDFNSIIFQRGGSTTNQILYIYYIIIYYYRYIIDIHILLCLDLFVTAFRIQEGQGEQRGADQNLSAADPRGIPWTGWGGQWLKPR